MAVNKKSLANLKPGKTFSSEYQPNRRRTTLFKMLADIIGEQDVQVSLTKDDMSSDKACEKHARRKPKVSCATFIGAG